ncbi:MAG: peptidoglycan editing factor PgeF [Oscillospiraceae bacterium]|nr:peptidoglycan editing factor PgeF [Oscillospiraceae bacterium]
MNASPESSRIFTPRQGKIPYLSIDLLERTGQVRTAVSLRQDADGAPVRLYWREGDDLEQVERATRIFTSQLGSDPGHIVMPHQEHTVNVRAVTEEDWGRSVDRSAFPATDGLITDIPDTVLMVYTADCLPLFFLDPVKKAIGLAHSGRKGTMGGIGPATVRAMEVAYGSRPEDILCAVGPSICGECYEVGDEIREQTERLWGGARADEVMTRVEGKWRLDLHRAAELTLLEAGLKREHVAVTDVCTRCCRDRLYSLRGDGRIVNQIASALRLLP